MKKLLSLLLALVLTLTLFVSCGKPETALTATELLDLGEKYLLDLNYEQAIVYFNQVIEVEPRNSRAYMGAAEAYIGLGDTESAINLLKTALEVFSDDEEVTIELLEMLIEIDPTTAEWYIILAQIYIDNGDTDKATEILQQGLANASDTAEIEALLNQLAPDLSELKPTSVYYYDEDGNIASSYLYEYDSDGNLLKETQAFTTAINISEYDSNGNLLTITSYDSNGEVSSLQEAEYDDNGNMIKHTTSNSGNVTQVAEYEYDSDGSLKKLTVQYVSYRSYRNGVPENTEWSTYYIDYEREYDSNGNVIKIVQSYSGAVNIGLRGDDGELYELLSTLTYEYEYDEYGAITKYTTTHRYTDGTIQVDTSENNYVYDSNGKVISCTHISNGVSITYNYEYEYEYGNDGKVQKCIETLYYADTGSIYSIATLERIS